MARGRPDRSRAIEQTAASFRQATGAMFAKWRKVAQQRGASPPQVWVIKILKERGGATPKELAEVMCVTPANITGLVAKLERHGFVTRKRDRKDRRVVRLEATPKAVKGLEAMQKAALASATEAFERWSTADILALKSMLDRFAKDAAKKAKGELTEGRRRRPRRP
jgi:DNA-binding MarR family transcriptional regulator